MESLKNELGNKFKEVFAVADIVNNTFNSNNLIEVLFGKTLSERNIA